MMMKKIIIFLLSFGIANIAIPQEIDCKKPIFYYKIKYVQVRDTVFECCIYQTDDHIDSIVRGDKMTRLSKTKWIGQEYPSGSYTVWKFRKVRPSAWFKENNGVLFNADFELDICAFQRFDPNGTRTKYWRFGTFFFEKTMKPKRQMQCKSRHKNKKKAQ